MNGSSKRKGKKTKDVNEKLLKKPMLQGQHFEKLEMVISKLCDLQVKQAWMIKKLIVSSKKGKSVVTRKFVFQRKKKGNKEQDMPSFELDGECNNEKEEMEKSSDVREDDEINEELEHRPKGLNEHVAEQIEERQEVVETDWGAGYEDPINTNVLVVEVDKVLEKVQGRTENESTDLAIKMHVEGGKNEVKCMHVYWH
ncbi:unnamed protein product [Cuscuta epithymum]|uniref:Uncharacterized protein n=1 Tax=Cuscuta epithymum TaxID=186058 RepID=A0AAV0G068_9ASTE|nr:unnamed protein product [Cuscuta epithymum]